MSSLSATQADGYYLPPAYFSSGKYKRKSKNQFVSNEGHNQYLQNSVVRFELPYDGYCTKCGAQVGKGTRFNAKKAKAEEPYFKSPTYEFRFKCRICVDCEFVVRTNPRKQSFDYVSGIYKRTYEIDASSNNRNSYNRMKQNNNNNHSLSKLESILGDKRKALTEQEELKLIIDANVKTFGEDVLWNRKIRASFRQHLKEKKSRIREGCNLGWREGMEVNDEEGIDDILKVKSTVFSNGKNTETKKIRELRISCIFDYKKLKGNKYMTASTVASPSPSNNRFQKQSTPPGFPSPRKKKKTIVVCNDKGKTSLTSFTSTKDLSTLDSLSGYDTD